MVNVKRREEPWPRARISHFSVQSVRISCHAMIDVWQTWFAIKKNRFSRRRRRTVCAEKYVGDRVKACLSRPAGEIRACCGKVIASGAGWRHIFHKCRSDVKNIAKKNKVGLRKQLKRVFFLILLCISENQSWELWEWISRSLSFYFYGTLHYGNVWQMQCPNIFFGSTFLSTRGSRTTTDKGSNPVPTRLITAQC